MPRELLKTDTDVLHNELLNPQLDSVMLDTSMLSHLNTLGVCAKKKRKRSKVQSVMEVRVAVRNLLTKQIRK